MPGAVLIDTDSSSSLSAVVNNISENTNESFFLEDEPNHVVVILRLEDWSNQKSFDQPPKINRGCESYFALADCRTNLRSCAN
jgi:hypothetical protein